MTLICGDEFKHQCNYEYHLHSHSLADVSPPVSGRRVIVFVQPEHVQQFLTERFPNLEDYILLTHNSDHAIPEIANTEYLGGKVHVWFAQNNHSVKRVCGNSSAMLTPIVSLPIGIANPGYLHGDVAKIREYLSDDSWSLQQPRTHLLYMNFSINTCTAERRPLWERFQSSRFCLHQKAALDFGAYLQEMSTCRFVLSPRGNGLDCHRTWEALLIGTIPIVRTSALDCLFERLPVVIVQEWTEVNEQFLKDKFEEICIRSKNREYEFARLSFDYWWKQVESYQ